MRRGAAWLACRAPPVAKDAPPGGQYYDEIEEDYADEEEDEEDTPQNRTKKLRSAVQRSAAPGRIADYYEFRKTLGALSFSLTHARALVRGHARRIGMSRGAERGRRHERARQSQPPPPIRSTPRPPPPFSPSATPKPPSPPPQLVSSPVLTVSSLRAQAWAATPS